MGVKGRKGMLRVGGSRIDRRWSGGGKMILRLKIWEIGKIKEKG